MTGTPAESIGGLFWYPGPTFLRLLFLPGMQVQAPTPHDDRFCSQQYAFSIQANASESGNIEADLKHSEQIRGSR